METKFKVGQKVKILSSGKKGLICEVSENPLVQLKTGDRININQSDLKAVKPGKNRIEFDMKRALAGCDIITRKGLPVLIIGLNDQSDYFKIVAEIEGRRLLFSETGRYSADRYKNDLDLFMKKSKRHPFDLERALAGEEVVTRDGQNVEEIRKRETLSGMYPVGGKIDGEFASFTEQGKYSQYIKKSNRDLFMRHPATNPVADGLDQVKEALTQRQGTPNQNGDYNKLKDTFTDLLEVLYERSDKGQCPKWEGMYYWNERAGLHI